MNIYPVRFFFILTSLLLLNLGCTQQSVSKARLSFQLPKQNKVNSSSCAGCNISFAAINIHTEGQPDPLVFTKDFKDSDSASESDLVVEVNDLTADTNVIVQFLVVLKNPTTGVRSFAYGDTPLQLQPGDNPATVLLQYIGGASKTGMVGGRLLDTINSGPTGTMVASINPPPGSDSPYPMQVFESEIFNGWFHLIAVDGTDALFTYTLKETGEVLFSNINIATFTSLPDVPYQIKATSKAYYSLRDSEIKAPRDIFMGFYPRDPNNTTLISLISAAGYQACYYNSDEAIPNLYEDSVKTDSLEFSGIGSLLDFTVNTATGSPKSFPQLFNAAPSNNCNTASGGAIRLNHQLLNEGDGGVFGLRGPFMLVDPFNGNSGFLTSVVGAPGDIKLSWRYLPGITSAEVEGVTLFERTNSSGSNDSDDEDLNCKEKAVEQGFNEIIDIPQAQTHHDMTGLGAGNEGNHNYKICPYKTVDGVRKYFAEGIESHCRGNCTQASSMGHGIADKTGVTGSFHGATTPGSTDIGGGYSQITTINAGSADYTQLTASYQTGHWVDGDEVLFTVAAEGNNGCGDVVKPGDFFFTRLFNRDVGVYKIPKGSFFDQMVSVPSINANLAASGVAANAASTFCRVHAAKVPNYKSLEITGNISSNTISLNGPGAASENGGIIAFRVNGLLDQKSNLSLAGVGFKGSNPGTRGAGFHGSFTSGVSTGSGGGAGTSDGGGGGGHGNGGSGTAGAPGGSGLTFNISGYSIFPGGGGGGISPSTGNGGNGGGSFFIVSNHHRVDAPLSIAVNGLPGDTTAGGGGGGSINVISNKLVGPGPLGFNANGGNGGNPSTGGGGGGGGWVYAGFCDNTAGTLGTITVNGGDGFDPGDGNPGMFSTQKPHVCND